MVLAFAGDSTMTSGRATFVLSPGGLSGRGLVGRRIADRSPRLFPSCHAATVGVNKWSYHYALRTGSVAARARRQLAGSEEPDRDVRNDRPPAAHLRRVGHLPGTAAGRLAARAGR